MSAKQSVTVVGLGPMGRATARILLAAGLDVTVWNRTPGKTEALVELGATPAATAAEAVAANDTVLLSLIHYDAMYGTLADADLTGKTIVNLSSDSPANTGKGASWVLERGARFLTGAYMTQSDDIQHPASHLYVSGPKDLHEELRPLLELLCANEYLGADYGLAQLYYQAGLAQFHSYLIALQQALAMIERSGGSVDRYLELTKDDAQSQRDFTLFFAEAAKQGGWGDPAALKMMHAGAQHVIDASEDAGVDASLTRTVQDYYRRAIDATEESGEFVSVYRLIRGATA
ncbi:MULTISPECIES: imine reductase family protein [Glycomyces]|uniref:3-hydroxyisobutyrate dehydrogenase-like beta-hydroxyacid dehydrogenase n=2 Tax=Glycomyces TaxID=58113 RepID=A0A9X3PDK1_9ACTN|nr:NAD(P)-binding domain-containing protein [Glycomyces lechevalierae]MDA1383350.1 NAD(P)-binding domain-containing protein [Glycomyces lechevalierae]MDR7336355.1 3-hydroxyisobutyrate dehydrogenase-like beta-hydroxyacid dehydrogenase [Glycomyces lechevalierae]